MPRDHRGEKNPAWKGGILKVKGYVLIHYPEHPFTDGSGYVKQHRLVLEEKLGRYLIEGEFPHHINGIKDDNRPENLEVVTRAEHASIHYDPSKIHSEAARKKISEKNSGNKVNLGRPCSSETREKISKALKDRGDMSEIANRRWRKNK